MKNWSIVFTFFSLGAAFLQPFSRQYREPIQYNPMLRKYPLSPYNSEWYLKRLNSQNKTIQNNEILNPNPIFGNELGEDLDDDLDEDDDVIGSLIKNLTTNGQPIPGNIPGTGMRIVLNKRAFEQLTKKFNEANGEHNDDEEERDFFGRPIRSTLKNKRSENFEVIQKSSINFNDVGGYNNIKNELYQCIDILSNYTKYEPFNVRVPKGLILEGPPGNGKTLLAKALAGEAKCSFIAVSGSEFQEKYVGVGSSRIRELFKLAKESIPCIIFIDEIDALGRKRSSDGDTSGNERDSTLNELLVALDGFKNTTGIFVVGATNRADLLDSALTRPGRIDKRIYIGNPDTETRRAILNIHSKGKPRDTTVDLEDLVEITNGLSGAQIENLLNEAMLTALRYNRFLYNSNDIDIVLNKMLAGWQPSEHNYTDNMIEQIAIHELGHAVVGLLSKHHSKMTKVVINFSSPKTPAYTLFESSASNILTREALFEHLMILLAGRIAEEVFYGVSVSTGAINDFEEALKLAQRMICYYGMGKELIYPSTSEKYKEVIDTEVAKLIHDAYGYAEFIVRNSKDLISEGAYILTANKVLTAETIITLMNEKYKSVLNLKV
jgi:cell division protease FtsH